MVNFFKNLIGPFKLNAAVAMLSAKKRFIYLYLLYNLFVSSVRCFFGVGNQSCQEDI